jgi:hypothetical protein
MHLSWQLQHNWYTALVVSALGLHLFLMMKLFVKWWCQSIATLVRCLRGTRHDLYGTEYRVDRRYSVFILHTPSTCIVEIVRIP